MISADLVVAKETGTNPASGIKQYFQWQICEQGEKLVPDHAAGSTQPFQVRFTRDIKQYEGVMKILGEAMKRVKEAEERKKEEEAMMRAEERMRAEEGNA